MQYYKKLKSGANLAIRRVTADKLMEAGWVPTYPIFDACVLTRPDQKTGAE